MADIVYTVNQQSTEFIAGFEQLTPSDKGLLNTFQLNSAFDNTKHFVELHILDLSDTLVESDNNYTNYSLLGTAASAGTNGASVVTIDAIADSKLYGYDNGGIKLLYHFLNDLYTTDSSRTSFYIDSISPDRTELKLVCLTLTDAAIDTYTSEVKGKLATQAYYNEFRLNFGNNDLFIGTNIDTLDSEKGKTVIVKLYEPLPADYTIKSNLSIVEVVADSVAYEVDTTIVIEQQQQSTLRPANFNLDITDEQVIPTQYFNYDELFSYPINNTNSQVYSMFNEKGVELSIDHTDFANFVHFSSAQERLINFKYKLDLVTSYSASLASKTAATSGSVGVSGSKTYYENLITGVVNNFDHYERFLYYESGSSSWPKSNTIKPYINKPSNTAESITWYADQTATAILYDQTNYNSLTYSIPTFIRDDVSNDNYTTFIYMIGQHFDNLWLYSKAVTDKYDGDNRLDHGISKDLVGEALKNFGVKLYTSNKSIEDLFTTYIGQSYQSGSEVINNYITGSLTGSNTPIQPTSYDDYQKEVQKRLYHNLPFLLKSKGTEKGLRALINCFGIPSDILKIKIYGGRNVNERPFFGDYQYYTSSLDKIRLDHTGSIVTGSTLSGNTSIVKRDPKYTDDLHNIEVGFSPVDNINAYIISQSSATFNIDDYIGDPRDLTSNSYTGLYDIAQTITSGSTVSGSYDLQDYVRLIKFFDNTIFKTIKDFIPARVVADTGIIIKPNLLNRSKANSTTLSGSRPEYTGSIDTAFVGGQDGGLFTNQNTSWTDVIQTPTGLASLPLHAQEEPRYNGEFSGSESTVTNGNLTEDNIYLLPIYLTSTDNVRFISASDVLCQLGDNFTETVSVYGTTYTPPQFFTGIPASGVTYTLTGVNPYRDPVTITAPFDFSTQGLSQYDTFEITAVDTNIPFPTCEATEEFQYGICDIVSIPNNQVSDTLLYITLTEDSPTQDVDLSLYFNINAVHNPQYLKYSIYKYDLNLETYDREDIQLVDEVYGDELPYTFDITDYENGRYVYIELTDTQLVPMFTCTTAFSDIFVASCTINTITPGQGTNPNGQFGRYYLKHNDVDPIYILQGGVMKTAGPDSGDDTAGSPSATMSPIHKTSYQFGNQGTVYDMTQLYPYLQNPNYIFENQDGTYRTALPVQGTDIQGYEMGLASFFKGLSNLNEIHYEVFAFRIESSGFIGPAYYGSVLDLDTGLSSYSNLVWFAGDGDINPLPNIFTSPPGAIRPGTRSWQLVGGEPIWTYDEPVPDIGGIPGQGYVAKLNLNALRTTFSLGERTYYIYQQLPSTPYGYLLKINAYTKERDGVGDIACFDTAYVFVESWIGLPNDSQGGPGGGG